ncbi:toxin-antitoxin system TumE family protein [Pyrofollis japonicus]|uniref:toxin-antitoxin system TumE family protein n=1 Tax=Pyrofollis japonicus TaxID=3060460 RepID=UPI0037C7AA8C
MWDNRPHHPEIPTHPHHRHIDGEVYPPPNPSLEDFLKRARSLLQEIGNHNA